MEQKNGKQKARHELERKACLVSLSYARKSLIKCPLIGHCQSQSWNVTCLSYTFSSLELSYISAMAFSTVCRSLKRTLVIGPKRWYTILLKQPTPSAKNASVALRLSMLLVASTSISLAYALNSHTAHNETSTK
jgi:hypothetical protein